MSWCWSIKAVRNTKKKYNHDIILFAFDATESLWCVGSDRPKRCF